MPTMREAQERIRRINEAVQARWTPREVRDYAEAIVAGTLDYGQVRQVGVQTRLRRQRNLRRIELSVSGLGLPRGYVNQYVDAYVRLGDVELAKNELRESPQYERWFPGNRRDDGTVRYEEREYQIVTESYAATLEDFGVNPDPFRPRFGALVEGDVAVDEFARRVDALYRRVVRAPAEVKEQFARSVGASSVSDSAILATALDPDIREQAQARLIDVATLVGQASRFGFNRSRQRAEELLDLGLDPGQAAEVYSGAARMLPRLRGSAATGGEHFGLGVLEGAIIGGDPRHMATIDRLDAQERARYSGAALARRGSTGALTGLET